MKINQHIQALVLTGLLASSFVQPVIAAEPTEQQLKQQATRIRQQSYASPEAAAMALKEAISAHSLPQIYAVLGPGSGKLIYSGDPVADQQARERFIAAYDQAVVVEYEGESKATLILGDNEWPFPYPLVKAKKGWRFDGKAGAEEVINRRIGENELFAIQTCLAIGDAQMEYAQVDRDNDGLLEYAQKIRSTAGKRDGLYWKAQEGETLSPLGPLMARANREGYQFREDKPVPYHGYYYRILKAQGQDAQGGAYSYMAGNSMIGGFAVVAYPANWGSSGVMTFTCSHEGVVYQKNLGSGSASVAKKMQRFNPGAGWSAVQGQE